MTSLVDTTQVELLDRDPVDATRACEYARPIHVLLHALVRSLAHTTTTRSLFTLKFTLDALLNMDALALTTEQL